MAHGGNAWSAADRAMLGGAPGAVERTGLSAAQAQGCKKCGALEGPTYPETIRGSPTAVDRDRTLERGGARPLQQKRRSCRGTDPRSGRPAARVVGAVHFKNHYWAGICAGCGVVSKALRRLGVAAREWEFNHGSWGDITVRENLRGLSSDVKRRRCRGGMFAPPCGTFSNAFLLTGTIRSTTEPLGKTRDLTEAQRAKVKAANKIVRAVLRIVKLFHEHWVPWIVEQSRHFTDVAPTFFS